MKYLREEETRGVNVESCRDLAERTKEYGHALDINLGELEDDMGRVFERGRLVEGKIVLGLEKASEFDYKLIEEINGT